MGHDFRDPDHLPNISGGDGADPSLLPRQRRGTTPQLHGRYPDYDCLREADHWDEQTRAVVFDRVENVPEHRFFDEAQTATLNAFCDLVLAQDSEPRVPVLAFVDRKLAEGRLDGYRYAGMPDDRETWIVVARGLDQAARRRRAKSFAAAPPEKQQAIVDAFAEGRLSVGARDRVDVKRAWSVVLRGILASFYSHPWTWNEIGFGGPAYPRGYAVLGIGSGEPWEADESGAADPASEPRAPRTS